MDYKKLRSEIYLQYGVDLDETSLTILHILGSYQIQQFTGQNKKLDNAVLSINQSKKVLQVDTQRPGRQAFWFGFGYLGMPVLYVMIIITILFIVYQNKKDNQNIQSVNLEWYKRYYDITKNGKRATEFVKHHPKPEDEQ